MPSLQGMPPLNAFVEQQMQREIQAQQSKISLGLLIFSDGISS